MRGKNILKTLVVTTVLALSMTTIHAADTNVASLNSIPIFPELSLLLEEVSARK